MKRHLKNHSDKDVSLRPRFDLTDLYPIAGLIGLASYFILG